MHTYSLRDGRTYTIDLRKHELAIDKVLRGYFKCLEHDNILVSNSVNDNDIEYLTDKVLEALLNA